MTIIRGYTCEELGVCNVKAGADCNCSPKGDKEHRHDTSSLPRGGFYFAPGTIEQLPRRSQRWVGQKMPMRHTTAVLLALLAVELCAVLLLAAGSLVR